MELLAVEMKLSATYVSRSLSWTGTEFEMCDLRLEDEQRRIYTDCCTFMLKLKRSVHSLRPLSPSGTHLVS